MSWTSESLLAYATERGGNADERHLIEAIEDITTDPDTRALIQAWFDIIDLLED